MGDSRTESNDERRETIAAVLLTAYYDGAGDAVRARLGRAGQGLVSLPDDERIEALLTAPGTAVEESLRDRARLLAGDLLEYLDGKR